MISVYHSLIQYFAAGGPPCGGGDFLVFPKWYKYLHSVPGVNPCAPQITSLGDIWLIAAAVIEVLLRVAAIIAVIFVVYAGFSYTTSQGDPEATGRAKGTLVNALVGLAIAVTAAVLVAFLARSIN